MGEMLGGGGTYVGHILPGIALVVLALAWVADDLRRPAARPGDGPRPLHDGVLVPWFKIVATSLGIWLEIPGREWYPMDIVMGWQHATVHLAILLSGITDLLHRSGRLPARATYLAFGGALMVGGAIFVGHGNHDGMSTVAHLLLGFLFLLSGLLVVLQAWVGPSLRRLGQGALLATGSWLTVIGWILFRSGWDPAAMTSTGWVWMAFCWNAMAAAVVFGVLAAVANDSHPAADPD